MRNLSLQRGDAFILVYDVTNAETFEEVRRIRDDIHKVRQTNTVPIVVVGNKIDLADTETREVSSALNTVRLYLLYFWFVGLFVRLIVLFFLSFISLTFFCLFASFHFLLTVFNNIFAISPLFAVLLCVLHAIRGLLNNSNRIRFCSKFFFMMR